MNVKISCAKCSRTLKVAYHSQEVEFTRLQQSNTKGYRVNKLIAQQGRDLIEVSVEPCTSCTMTEKYREGITKGRV